jgi:hypothetical protein
MGHHEECKQLHETLSKNFIHPHAVQDHNAERFWIHALLIVGACKCLGWRDCSSSTTTEKRQHSNLNRCIFGGIDLEESQQALEIA